MLDKFKNIKEIVYKDKKIDVRSLSPLVLAYIGDSVYEVAVRTLLVSQGDLPVHTLHVQSTRFVKAKAQANIVHNLMDKLTEEEIAVVKRGRNAKSGTVPKNADITDYKYATGFEALIGYLYLTDNYHRLDEIINMVFDMYKNNSVNN